jgi:hypothetical protein
MDHEWKDFIEDLLEGSFSDEGLNMTATCDNVKLSVESSKTEQVCHITSSVKRPFADGELEIGMTHEGGASIGVIY